MSFDLIKADIPLAPLTPRARELIDAADRMGDRFFAAGGQRRTPRFVPSHAELVYSGLSYIKEHDLALGDRFLEWGSGLGVSSCLASLLGFQATGIEIQPRLVDLARQLARQSRLDTEFIARSYFPPGLSSYEAQGGDELMRSGSRRHQSFSYPEADFTLDEVDLFFVYPWPEEQDLMLQLFDATASPDALLLIHFGPKELCLYQKT